MRLLVDQNLARRVAALLCQAGHDAVHVAERGLAAADDEEILTVAVAEDRVVISEDTDFATLLARSGARSPSFVLIRSAEPLRPEDQAALLVDNIATIQSDLVAGAVVVFARGRIRIRSLPILPAE